jgi:hypothetical protein
VFAHLRDLHVGALVTGKRFTSRLHMMRSLFSIDLSSDVDPQLEDSAILYLALVPPSGPIEPYSSHDILNMFGIKIAAKLDAEVLPSAQPEEAPLDEMLFGRVSLRWINQEASLVVMHEIKPDDEPAIARVIQHVTSTAGDKVRELITFNAYREREEEARVARKREQEEKKTSDRAAKVRRT